MDSKIPSSRSGPPAGAAPLRIAINATAAVTGGGVTYWLNLLPALAEIGRPHTYHVLFSAAQRQLPRDLPENFRIEHLRFPKPASLARLVWEQTGLPLRLKRDGIDVLLAAADMAPLLTRCPVVMAVRNPNPYWGPKASTLKGRIREHVLRALTRMSAKRASHVFFVSEDSRRRISPALGLPSEKTSVVYHGIGHRFLNGASPEETGGGRVPARPYVLTVSTVRIHKDYGTLLRAFAGLRGRVPSGEGYRLVIAGALIDPPYHASLQGLAAELGISEAVSFFGEVDYASLPALYRGAEMFVLPSLAETFGHPLVEAMASGTPVIASDLEVVREICGAAGDYFEPGDWEQLRERMTALASDPEMRSRRARAGRERAREFSWSRCARETLALLEGAAYRERSPSA